MPRRTLIGIVTRDGAAKTRRVEIERLVRHSKYTKVIRRKTVCHVHDENNESHLGDKVEIEECRPLSALKRWTLLRVVEKSKEVDLAKLKAARTGGVDLQANAELAGSAKEGAS
jgi:small subunit ribosomal protein S17